MTKKAEYTVTVLMAVTGAACILLTDQVHRVLPWALGGMMTAIGLITMAKGLQMQEYKSPESRTISAGMVVLLTGLVMLFKRESADGLIGVVWGLFGLIKGAKALSESFYAMYIDKPWLGGLLRSLLELGLGLLLIFDPFGKVHTHLKLLGVELLFLAFQNFHDARQRAGEKEAIH